MTYIDNFSSTSKDHRSYLYKFTLEISLKDKD